ncbi:MAG: hypothetical protein ABII18_01140 [bacterium]|nr:hypothetical protein [bacterium]MBU1917635.1 hypothetical protein [bacterium]
MKKLSFFTVLITGLIIISPVLAQATTPSAAQTINGMKLIDTTRKVEFSSPNELWSINAGKYSISLNHNTHFDAHVTLKKSWYNVSSAQEAYDKRKNSLKSYLPSAIFIRENESITLPDNVKGKSMTYKNPSDLKVVREIMFVHDGKTFELVFQAKEDNFQIVKEDFKYILQNMKLFQ